MGVVAGVLVDSFLSAYVSSPRRLRHITDGLDLGALGDRMRRVAWDDVATLAERIERDLGGPEAMFAYAQRFTAEAPMMRAMALAMRDERELMLSMAMATRASVMPHFEHHVVDRGAIIEMDTRIPPAFRPCAAFLRAFAGGHSCAIPPAFPEPFQSECEVAPDRVRLWVRPRPRVREVDPDVRVMFDELAARAREAQQLVTGQGPIDDRVMRAAAAWRLTPREREALEAIVQGATNKEIAARWDRSTSVVELHVTSLLRKAGVQSRTELVARCLAR